MAVSFLAHFAPSISLANAPWSETENRIEQMKIRQKLVEEQLRTLVLSRPHLNPETRPAAEEEIKLRVKDLNDIRSELKRLSTILRYRFPERALGQNPSVENDLNKPIKVEEISARITLDDTLQRVYESAIKKFDRGPASVAPSISIKVSEPPKEKARSINKLQAPILNIGQ